MGYYNNKNNNRNRHKKPQTFEEMLNAFLKTSKEKQKEAVREHTKSDEIKKKKDNALRRKDAIKRRNRADKVKK